MKTKYVSVTTTAQDIDFEVGRTDFLIQNYSDIDVTVNIDEDAVIGADGNAVVLAKTTRQLGEMGKVISIIASSACEVEIQAVNPSVVVIDNSTLLKEI